MKIEQQIPPILPAGPDAPAGMAYRFDLDADCTRYAGTYEQAVEMRARVLANIPAAELEAGTDPSDPAPVPARGVGKPRALTEDQLRQVRELLAQRALLSPTEMRRRELRVRDIAARFGVHTSIIYAIANGTSYSPHDGRRAG